MSTLLKLPALLFPATVWLGAAVRNVNLSVTEVEKEADGVPEAPAAESAPGAEADGTAGAVGYADEPEAPGTELDGTEGAVGYALDPEEPVAPGADTVGVETAVALTPDPEPEADGPDTVGAEGKPDTEAPEPLGPAPPGIVGVLTPVTEGVETPLGSPEPEPEADPVG